MLSFRCGFRACCRMWLLWCPDGRGFAVLLGVLMSLLVVFLVTFGCPWSFLRLLVCGVGWLCPWFRLTCRLWMSAVMWRCAVILRLMTCWWWGVTFVPLRLLCVLCAIWCWKRARLMCVIGYIRPVSRFCFRVARLTLMLWIGSWVCGYGIRCRRAVLVGWLVRLMMILAPCRVS